MQTASSRKKKLYLSFNGTLVSEGVLCLGKKRAMYYAYTVKHSSHFGGLESKTFCKDIFPRHFKQKFQSTDSIFWQQVDCGELVAE